MPEPGPEPTDPQPFDQQRFDLQRFPAHLGLGATVVPQSEFTGDPTWYEDYGARTASDGNDARLVSMHTFTGPWDTWEMHPEGHELVVCTAGTITLHQEVGGDIRQVTLTPGQAAINDPGVWHTADVDPGGDPCTCLFVTAGRGTQIRAR